MQTYEALLIAPLCLIASLIATPLIEWIHPSWMTDSAHELLRARLNQLLIIITLYYYFAYHWVNGRQTLPMKVAKYHLHKTDGRFAQKKEVALRFIAGLLMTSIPLGLILFHSLNHTHIIWPNLLLDSSLWIVFLFIFSFKFNGRWPHDVLSKTTIHDESNTSSPVL